MDTEGMGMRFRMLFAAALVAASPVAAQEPDGGFGEGLDLLGEGSRMILERLLEDMRPMLDSARPFFEEELMPLLERLGEVVDDLSHYELPERLPNGDIVIRRSPDAPPFGEVPSPGPGADPLPEVGEGGEVEL
jgi:hypothetical protein